VLAWFGAGGVPGASAQDATPPAAPTAEPAAPATATPETAPATEAPAAEVPATEAPAALPEFEPLPLRRSKPLQVSVGRSPTSLDVGNEADMMAVADEEAAAAQLKDWSFQFKGYLRAGIGVGLGPRNDGGEGLEVHSPPRIIGGGSGRWEYASLNQNPSLSLYFNFSNPLVSANIIMSASTLVDSSFEGNLDRASPGVRQAYLILKYPDAFGYRGGLSLTVGGFSNRYGSAGREQVSSGYYGAYLFGRTHVAGYTLTADIDLDSDWELVLEQGLGAKLEAIPFLNNQYFEDFGGGDVRDLDYFEGQGRAPQGSNFAHHVHAGVLYRGWLMMAAHYLTSWTPDDNNQTPPMPGVQVEEGRATVVGAEVHVDGDAIGNGYLGFSHVDVKNVLPLGNAVQLPHGSTGRSFAESFFGARDRIQGFTPTNDTGTVDTLLFQYTLGLAQYMGQLPLDARDIRMAWYAMFNHAVSPKTDPNSVANLDVDTYKLKWGTEWQMDTLSWLTLGFQFDYVQPDISDTKQGYLAITPRAIIRSTWESKERILLSYTHFFLGDTAFPASPFSDILESDSELFTLTAIMSF